MNIVLIAAGIITICTAVNGYKKGLLQELISVITLVAGIALLAILFTIANGYITKEYSHIMMGIILFIVVVLLMQITQFVTKGLKLVFDLPVISGVNKLAGFVLGVAEGILFIWILFLLLQYFNLGNVETLILHDVEENEILSYLYDNNYLRYIFPMNFDLATMLNQCEALLKNRKK